VSFATAQILPKSFITLIRLEFLRNSVDNSQRALGTIKKIDLFQPARMDSAVGVQKVMENLIILKDEGKFDHIGLSECNANTLRIAHAVCNSHNLIVPGTDWAFRFILLRLLRSRSVPGHMTITRRKLLPPQRNSISPSPLTRIWHHYFFRFNQLMAFTVP
jgi:hypothetical protein